MPTEAYQQGYSDYPKWNPPSQSIHNEDWEQYSEGWNDAQTDSAK